jgi:hypothetical protein
MAIQAAGIIKNFSGLKTLEEVCAQLDLVLSRLADAQATNPSTVSLLNAKEAVPTTKAGDLILDYRSGVVVPGMSDGKSFKPFQINTLGGAITPEQHGQLASNLFDEDGNPIGALHDAATTALDGFMSAADKSKLNGLTGGSAAVPADASAGSGGVANTYARSDHTHQVLVGTPVTIAATNAAGSSTNLARADHVHAHGNLAGGTFHAVATTGAAGFMSAADKTELDRLNGFNIGLFTTGGHKYIIMSIGATTYAFGPEVPGIP